jgi:hypothetical protein
MLEAKFDIKEHHDKELKFKVIGGMEASIERAQCGECETTFDRKSGGKVLYVREKGKNDYYCGSCKSDILVSTVAHPIHDGPFPLSGSGKCQYEYVPYCPKCEKETPFHGDEIRTGPFA